ncbi:MULTISPECIES: hypothetical protein [Methylomonas]|uniref:hypothetical protein n=1 Tax=Methylomonas TaxID=416 RepID=UPI0016818A56|nr:hypothetical protein [Methylomonas rhizoryzae]
MLYAEVARFDAVDRSWQCGFLQTMRSLPWVPGNNAHRKEALAVPPITDGLLGSAVRDSTIRNLASFRSVSD